MQLESDPPAAVRAMRKILSAQTSSNPVLLLLAEKALGAVAPDAIAVVEATRRATAKGRVAYELRSEIEAEVLERCGLPVNYDGTRTAEELEDRDRIIDAIERMFGLSGRRRFDLKPPVEVDNSDNVVTVAFGRPDGGAMSPGAA
jgi:hypothetical protein